MFGETPIYFQRIRCIWSYNIVLWKLFCDNRTNTRKLRGRYRLLNTQIGENRARANEKTTYHRSVPRGLPYYC